MGGGGARKAKAPTARPERPPRVRPIDGSSPSRGAATLRNLASPGGAPPLPQCVPPLGICHGGGLSGGRGRGAGGQEGEPAERSHRPSEVEGETASGCAESWEGGGGGQRPEGQRFHHGGAGAGQEESHSGRFRSEAQAVQRVESVELAGAGLGPIEHAEAQARIVPLVELVHEEMASEVIERTVEGEAEALEPDLAGDHAGSNAAGQEVVRAPCGGLVRIRHQRRLPWLAPAASDCRRASGTPFPSGPAGEPALRAGSSAGSAGGRTVRAPDSRVHRMASLLL